MDLVVYLIRASDAVTGTQKVPQNPAAVKVLEELAEADAVSHYSAAALTTFLEYQHPNETAC